VITFEFTRDFDLVKRIVTDPKVFPFICDDNSPKAEDYEPHKEMLYVHVRDEEQSLGIWAFFSHNSICWEIHTCLLPCAYGERASKAARTLAEWIWTNTNWQRVITNVPESNRLALMFALKAGLTRFAVNPKSYLKDGKLLDQVMLGISRPGV
jgi:hypothetical protein